MMMVMMMFHSWLEGGDRVDMCSKVVSAEEDALPWTRSLRTT